MKIRLWFDRPTRKEQIRRLIRQYGYCKTAHSLENAVDLDLFERVCETNIRDLIRDVAEALRKAGISR